MSNTYTIAKGQSSFPKMVRDAEKTGVAVVTRHEKAVAYLISAERMEAMMETMELLANPDFLKALKTEKAGKTKYRPLNELPD